MDVIETMEELCMRRIPTIPIEWTVTGFMQFCMWVCIELLLLDFPGRGLLWNFCRSK